MLIVRKKPGTSFFLQAVKFHKKPFLVYTNIYIYMYMYTNSIDLYLQAFGAESSFIRTDEYAFRLFLSADPWEIFYYYFFFYFLFFFYPLFRFGFSLFFIHTASLFFSKKRLLIARSSFFFKLDCFFFPLSIF